MSSYGPYTATAGTVTQVTIPGDSDRVRIQNDSPYDVLVSFAVAKPNVATSTNGDWQESVLAWHHATMEIPGQAHVVTPLGTGTFNGSVWLLPINSGSLALTGTTSGRSNLWVSAFRPGEMASDVYSAPRQQDMTSQPRIVSVPIGLPFGVAGIWRTTDANPFQIAAFGLSAAQKTSLAAPVYLYYANLTPEGSAGAASGFDVVIQAQPQTAIGANLGSPIVLARGGVQYNSATAGLNVPWVCAPAWPIGNPSVVGIGGGLPAGTTQIAFQLYSPVGTRFGLNYTIAVSMDLSNTVYDGDIGNQTYSGGWSGTGTAPLF